MNADYIIKNLIITDDEQEYEVNLPNFGPNFLIVFEGTEVTEEQKISLTFLLNEIHDLYPKIEIALYKYYLESMEVYRDALGEYADELMPGLTKQSDVWKYINEPGVYFPNVSNEFEFEFEATFDVEHGVRVFMKDGKIVGVGLQC